MRLATKAMFAFATLLLLLGTIGISVSDSQQYNVRGKYVYDSANVFSYEGRAALSSVLFNIDQTSNYEFVVATSNTTFTEAAMIAWFNQAGVGKSGRDNGMVLFIFTDTHKYFVAIGSGNDVVTVTMAKAYGEPIMAKFNDDPVFATLRFVKIFDSQLQDKTVSTTRPYDWKNAVVDNVYIIALWGAALMMGALLVGEIKEGLEWQDLIVPIVILLILGGVFAVSYNASQVYENNRTEATYGIIDSTHRTGPILRVVPQTICTGSGKSLHCITIMHDYYDYFNKVQFIGYDLKQYSYTYYSSCEGHCDSAWHHYEGDVQQLIVSVHGNSTTSATDVNDNSGGKTVGDGIWGSLG